MLKQRISPSSDANKELYLGAKRAYNGKTIAEVRQAKTIFDSLGNYKDSAAMSEKCQAKLYKLYEQEAKIIYQLAYTHYKNKNSIEHLVEAKRLWESIPNYKDSSLLAEKCTKYIEKLTTKKKKNIPAIISGIIVAVILIILAIGLIIYAVKPKYPQNFKNLTESVTAEASIALQQTDKTESLHSISFVYIFDPVTYSCRLHFAQRQAFSHR